MTTSADDSGQFHYPAPALTHSHSVRYPLGGGARTIARLTWPDEQFQTELPGAAAQSAPDSDWGQPWVLGSRQLARASAYYLRHASRYPTALVRVLQTRLGLLATGDMDARTIVAVARFQRAEGLSVCDGQAGEVTLTAMFGADVRMRVGACPGPVVSREGVGGIAAGSVKLTDKIKRAWRLLRPHLPASAVLISGLHTWADSARMLEDSFVDSAAEIVAKGMLTRVQVADILATRNYRQMYNWAWTTKGGLTPYKISLPGHSRHCGGGAFDIAGASVRSIVTGVANARLAAPKFNALFAGYTPEPGSHYVHIDVR